MKLDQFYTVHSILDVHTMVDRPYRCPVSDSGTRKVSVFPLSSLYKYYVLSPVEYCSSIDVKDFVVFL